MPVTQFKVVLRHKDVEHDVFISFETNSDLLSGTAIARNLDGVLKAATRALHERLSAADPGFVRGNATLSLVSLNKTGLKQRFAVAAFDMLDGVPLSRAFSAVDIGDAEWAMLWHAANLDPATTPSWQIGSVEDITGFGDISRRFVIVASECQPTSREVLLEAFADLVRAIDSGEDPAAELRRSREILDAEGLLEPDTAGMAP